MGSKSRIAKYIVPILQKYIDENNIETYIEPFVGGANVIDKITCEHKVGSDKNKYLIALLNHVKMGLDLYNKVSKELYDDARNAFNSGDTSFFEDWQIGNIGFIASYNGRWFDGGYAKSGYEKLKNGKQRFRDYYEEAKNNILTQADDLKDISFYGCDYTYWSSMENCLIYCDPPYQGTKQYSNAMTFDYEKFWQWCMDMSEKNIVIVSEQNAPSDFECIWSQEVSRSIKATDKSRSTEKLFTYKN